MKRLIGCFILILNVAIIYSQQLNFTVSGGKQGRINIQTSKIINNEFTMNIKVVWLNTKLTPIEDKNSRIVFKKTDIIIPGNNNLKCLTFKDNKTPLLYFNDELSLNFIVTEEILDIGNTFLINFPFKYAASLDSALNESVWTNFLAKSPRNFAAELNLNPKDIKDLTPPQITVISPEGVMDGYRPEIYEKDLEVKVLIKERNSISHVLINNTKAIPINDSTYISKVSFTRSGGTYPITIEANDEAGNKAEKEFYIQLNQSIDLLALQNTKKTVEMVSDVDTLIPDIGRVYENKYALIIGNEDYQSYQKGLNYESNVEFANRDAEIFREYAIKTLGIKPSNIIFMTDAKAIEMHRGINQLNSLIKATNGKAEAIVYFAGHGFPDEKTKEAYIVPVDVSGNDLEFGIKLFDFYKKLYEYPSKGVTVFLDACFSGGGREQGLIAARGVKIKPKSDYVNGNLVVFSASSGSESALPYRAKYHGMFTYYLLKYFQESNGDILMGNLVEYVTNKVSTSSIIFNNKEQTPTPNISYQLSENWKEIKLNQ